MSDAVRDGDSSCTASPHLGGTTVGIRSCMLTGRLGRREACSDQCPLWEGGGAVVPAGCALERLLAAEDWPPALAGRWLRIRDHAADKGTRDLLSQLFN